jgi:hypothetical protein
MEMDCRQFRENHCAFTDDTLAGIEIVRMQRHISECEQCARLDWSVRRSLMVFRNLPSIEPSENFEARLQEKIRQSVSAQAAQDRSFRFAGATAAVLGMMMLAYIITALPGSELREDVIMPPVVASVPEFDIPAVSAAGPAIVMSVSAGLPIWTAALYAEQAPEHFAHPELMLASYTR